MAKRVRNEVALHTKLRHPNILNLYHYFEDDERVYLVMELCSRGEIYTLLKNRRDNGESSGTLNENEARVILRDVVAGLKFLHFHSIIHRDLKLSNILLSENGQAKIADFGLAVRTEFTDSSASDSRERTICGTPNYLAPEILNKKNYGKAADIWSLGCLLFSFLTGRPPFDSPDLPQTFDKVKRLDYNIPDHLSPAARDLITRLLAGDPSNRPTFDQIIWHPFFNPSVTEPLTIRRLSPMKQVTKYGNIEIGDGKVSVDFLDSGDILVISGDVLRVDLIDKRTEIPVQMLTPITNLPGHLKKRYEYARRFVNLVKSKTPLIILSTSTFKAYLMENSIGTSGGDFYLNYRNGNGRAEYCWVSRNLRIFDTCDIATTGGSTISSPTITINDPSPLALTEISSPQHRQILLEFLARYRQCLHIRDTTLHADGSERSKYRGIKFPVIIKENCGGVEDVNRSEHSSTAVMNASIFNNNNNNNSNSSSNVFGNSNHRIVKPLPFNNGKYLQGIGWCLETETSTTSNSNTTSFLVLFNDGRCIQIDGAADTVLNFQTGLVLPINSQLPADVKEMLALFSKFL